MNIVLVDNLILPEAGSLAAMDVHPHLGLLALAAAAHREEHAIEIVDPKRLVRDGALPYAAGLYARMADHILARRPDVVGFTALGCSLLFAVRVAALLKAATPAMPILLGGPHATMLHREILARYPQFDIIVRYEADETFPAVLARLDGRRFEDVPGISWRTSDGLFRETPGAPKIADLDTLSITDYDLYPVETLGLDLMRIEAGRGCPFACTFCSTAGFFQRSFRLKSAGRLVDELDRLHARYGCRSFKLDHDMFTTNKRKVQEFCDAVADRGYRWSASARVDCVDAPLLGAMAAAGCVNLYFGIETGSPRMQEIARKRLDLALVEPILARADALGIETTASFITGFPEETDDDLDATLDLIGALGQRPSCLTQLHLLAPEPGTPLFDALGATIRYDGVAGPYHCGLLETGDEAEIRSAPEIYQTYHHYPSRLARSRSIRAAALVELVRRMGPTVAPYLLRFFRGRLSLLSQVLDAFALTHGPAVLDDAMLIDFLIDRFGPRHHLVSLLRIALTGGVPDARTADRAPFDPARAYVVAPDLISLDDVHDWDALVAEIRALPEDATLAADDDGASERYLAVPRPEGLSLYKAEPAASALLGLFAQPRTPCAALDALSLGRARAETGSAVLAQLAGAGLIVPVSAATAAAERDAVLV